MDGYIERQTLQDIADAIREKNGSSDTYKPSEMAEAILDLSGSVNLQDKSVTITENGTQTIVADEGFDGLSSVEVTADVEKNAGFDLVSRGMTQEFQDEVNANLLKDAIDYTITTMNRTSDSGSWSGKFVNSRILFCTKSLKNITNLHSVFESTHIYAMVDLDIAKASNIYHFFYQSTCPYIPSYIDLSGLGSGNNASAFRSCKILKNENTLTINVGWLADKNNLIDAGYLFNDSSFNGTVTAEIIGDRLLTLGNTFWGSGGITTFRWENSENVTSVYNFFRDTYIQEIILGSLEKCSAFNVAFGKGIKNLKFTHWKRGAISIDSANLTPESIHFIIQNAMSVADGATARTLTLKATAKANWEASEYYEQDLAVLEEKGITIA